MSNVQEVRQSMQAVTMELGGKERTLQFDMNAFAELENRFGSIESAMNQLTKGKMNDIKLILWTSLIHEEAELDPETGEPIKYNITPYQVGSWIKNPAMLQEASVRLADAMGLNMPAEADLKKNEPTELAADKEAKNV